MKILGIDPGSKRIGYGIIEKNRGTLAITACGILEISNGDPSQTLPRIKKAIVALIQKHQPRILAIEKLYFSKNQKTAFAVAEARGVVVMVASEAGLSIKEYAPNEVKAGITGYGFADKKAVAKMVRVIFKRPDLAVIDDTSDALALCYIASRSTSLPGLA